MKRKRTARAFRPTVGDELEARLVLSSGGVQAGPLAAARAMRLALDGTISGTARVVGLPIPIADAPTVLSIDGSGRVRPLGRVSAQASLNLGGFRDPRSPQTDGTLTLAGPRGSVTLRVEGGVPPTTTTPPPRLRFTIESGTGAYARATGQGTARIVTFTIQPDRSIAFTLELTPAGRR